MNNVGTEMMSVHSNPITLFAQTEFELLHSSEGVPISRVRVPTIPTLNYQIEIESRMIQVSCSSKTPMALLSLKGSGRWCDCSIKMPNEKFKSCSSNYGLEVANVVMMDHQDRCLVSIDHSDMPKCHVVSDGFPNEVKALGTSRSFVEYAIDPSLREMVDLDYKDPLRPQEVYSVLCIARRGSCVCTFHFRVLRGDRDGRVIFGSGEPSRSGHCILEVHSGTDVRYRPIFKHSLIELDASLKYLDSLDYY